MGRRKKKRSFQVKESMFGNRNEHGHNDIYKKNYLKRMSLKIMKCKFNISEVIMKMNSVATDNEEIWVNIYFNNSLFSWFDYYKVLIYSTDEHFKYDFRDPLHPRNIPQQSTFKKFY